MGRIYALLLVAVFVIYVSAEDLVPQDQCTAILKCDKCEDRPLECVDCADRKALKKDGKGCLDCGANCKECEDSGDSISVVCTECDRGYVVKAGACIACSTGCEYCNVTGATTACQTCYAPEGSQYYSRKDADSTCIACPSNCKVCANDANGVPVCSQCVDRYALKADKSCSVCPDNNCASCSDNNNVITCSACKPNYGLQTEGTPLNKCLLCPASCTACNGKPKSGATSNAECTACAAGKYLKSGECLDCGTAITNCKACDDETTCTDCNSGSRLDNKICPACVGNCDTCPDTTTCGTCNERYGVAGGAKVCDECSVSNCLTCPTDPATCTACTGKYYATMGSCSACPIANCDVCSADGMTCTTCKANYLGAGTSMCETCTGTTLTNCKTCTDAATDLCTECDTGHLPKNDNEACFACTVANCVTCSADNTCDGCKDGFGLNSGACEACTVADCKKCSAAKATCTDCNDKFFLMSAACTACSTITNCDTCSSATACTKCDTGYLPQADNMMCHSCTVSKCTTCSAAATCTACESGYYLKDASTCSPCGTNCATCDSSNVCQTCITPLGQHVVDTAITANCLTCDVNCDTCSVGSGGSGECTDCKVGFTVAADKSCVACPVGCAECMVDPSSTTPLCTSCATDRATSSDQCARCPANCKACTLTDGVMKCDSNKCDALYALDSAGNECKKCPTNCKTCVFSGGNVLCNDCQDGYGLSADKQACTGCAILTTISFCDECTDATAAGVSTCEDCANGYTFKSDKSECRSCTENGITNCGECEDEPFTCLTCADTYAITKEKKCAHLCYTCEDDDCAMFIPTENSTTEACFPGTVCFSFYEKDGTTVKHSRGCANDTLCTSDNKDKEYCTTTDGKDICSKCCETDKCNNDGPLKGMTDNGCTGLTFHVVMLVVSILAAIGLRM